MESTFVSGFSYCKDGTRCFSRHEDTAAHKAAVDVTLNIPRMMLETCCPLKPALPLQSSSKHTVFVKARDCFTWRW